MNYAFYGLGVEFCDVTCKYDLGVVSLNNQIGLEEAGTSDQNILDETVFGYTDSERCPLSTCTLHAAGDCGGSIFQSSELSMTGSSPWTLDA